MQTDQRKTLRILAADDSAVMRGIMRRLFSEYVKSDFPDLPHMELCGVAHDGVECLEQIEQLRPDVLMLDLEMPRLNGLQVLEQLRRQGSKLPVIMCSAHTDAGARLTLNALALGAVDYVTKPSQQRDPRGAFRALAEQLLPRLAAASGSFSSYGNVSEERSLDSRSPSRRQEHVGIVVIGVSTGGPTALEQIVPNLPADFAVPVLIAQHMPKLFTQALAERLDRAGAIRVQQAYEGALLAPGTVWLAPGGFNMTIATPAESTMAPVPPALHKIRLSPQLDSDHCTPSVDRLFESAAAFFGESTLGLVLTGMGEDGLAGAREIHRCGGTVLAQDEATSAVWGMPGRIAQTGLAAAILPLSRIGADLTRRVSRVSDASLSGKRAFAKLMTAQQEVPYGMHGR